jgi:DNA-binding GntR family transcriptional regulator
VSAKESPVANGDFMPRTRTQVITDELRRQIQAGELAAGTPLRQVEIAARFGASTTPVREAFSALQREGLLQYATHRGAVVFRPSLSDLRENYEIRVALESLAAEHAAREATPERLEAIEAFHAVMEAAITDPVEFARLNRDLHRLIYEAAGRPRLSALIDTLRDAATAYVHVLATHTPDSRIAHAEHARIVAALRAHAPRKAAKATADHLNHNFERIAAELADAG